MTERMLSVKEAMALTGKSSLTIRNWINKGKLNGAIKSPGGKEWMIPESALAGSTNITPDTSQETVTPVPQATSTESSEVKRAKEAADIAASKDKQVEYEISTKLRERGYRSIEEGLEEIKKKKEDANLILEEAKKEAIAITAQKEEFEKEKEKCLNLYTMVKQREETVDARLEQAIVIEKGLGGNRAKCEVIIEEVKELMAYHDANIKPCVRALRVIRKSIYSWIEPLADTKYDFTILYNHIGRVMKSIEYYLENVPKSIPPDVIPEIIEDEPSKQ